MHIKITEAIRTFSPRHAGIIQAAAQATSRDIVAVATAVRAELERLNVNEADFPNPFGSLEDNEQACKWLTGFYREGDVLPDGIADWVVEEDEPETEDDPDSTEDNDDEDGDGDEEPVDPIEEDANREPTGEPGGNTLPQ